MKAWKMIIVAVLAVVAVTIVTASVYAYGMSRQGVTGSYGTYTGGAGPYETYHHGMMGGSMMGGRADGPMFSEDPPANSYPQTPLPTQPDDRTYPHQYWGSGCMRAGWNGYAAPTNPNNWNYTRAITIDTAMAIAQRYLTSLNNQNLAVDEIEEYTYNFYVLYYEKSTGIGAFEMLIDKYSGSLYPEMGPNMMWNTKYGMMSGMMGSYQATPSAVMPITVDQAKAAAQQFLNDSLPGTTVGNTTIFYGYYRVEVLSSGNTYGMLSVNGYTGQPWYHTWHGTFIQQLELGS